jgi:hypothetical protein
MNIPIVILIIIFTFIIIREKFTVTPGAKIQIKYIAEDPGGIPNGLLDRVGNYSIHTGKVSQDGTKISWDKMTSYKSNGSQTFTPKDDTYNNNWFGNGNTAPTAFVRFPTINQLKSSKRPSRNWPEGDIQGEIGADEDTCINGLKIYKPGWPELWRCGKKWPNGWIAPNAGKDGDGCISGNPINKSNTQWKCD